MNLVNESIVLIVFSLLCLLYMIAVFIIISCLPYHSPMEEMPECKKDSPKKEPIATNAATTMPCASLSDQSNTNIADTPKKVKQH